MRRSPGLGWCLGRGRLGGMIEDFGFFFSFGRGWFLVLVLVSFGFWRGLMRSRRELWWFLLLERR